MKRAIYIHFRSTSIKLIAALGAMLACTSAQAVCGKQCKEAKNFCSVWEESHPGEECGRVRGLICNPPGSKGTWKKIKQVNSYWAACHLVKGEEDLHDAQRRCEQVEENERNECEVHSPHCNAGWAKIADYGKFQACRRLQPSGSLVYDSYKAWMRKWEGTADTPLPSVLAAFVEKHYPHVDTAKIRFGYVPAVKSATCITDCNHIYCDNESFVTSIRKGVLSADGDQNPSEFPKLFFHELTHVQECAKLGSREAYAKNWFKSASAGFLRALAAHEEHEFTSDIHDLMPTEQMADENGIAMAREYEGQWWNRLAHCRIYKTDRKTIVYEMPDRHTRTACTPGGNIEIEERLNAALQEAANAYGSGIYWLAHGRPDLGEPRGTGDDTAGFWIVSRELRAEPQRVPPPPVRNRP